MGLIDQVCVFENNLDMYAKLGDNSAIMPEVERVLADMQERLTKLQVRSNWK